MTAAHPSVSADQAANAYRRAQDLMRAEAKRRRAEADTAQDVSAE